MVPATVMMPTQVAPAGAMQLPMAPVPMVMSSVCDRTSIQKGATRLQHPNSIQIRYNAEVRDNGCLWNLFAMCGCLPVFTGGKVCAPPCSFFDKGRSYLYLREGSIEYNVSTGHLCLSCPDNVSVQYFDRPPFARKGCICPDEPKLEIFDTGYMCCCIKIECTLCFGKNFMVLMPFERTCFGLCPNRTNCCHNCCNLCGPVSGNPCVFMPFHVQPVNTASFVAMAKQTIPQAQIMR